MDTTNTAAAEQLQLVNHSLATTAFYIGTTRRRIAGLDLTVSFNREQGIIAGSISIEAINLSHQPGQRYPFAATPITIRGDDRQRVVGAGSLDDAGRYAIVGLQPQLCYYLQFGEE